MHGVTMKVWSINVYEGLVLTHCATISGYTFFMQHTCFQLTPFIFVYAKFCRIFTIIDFISNKFTFVMKVHCCHMSYPTPWLCNVCKKMCTLVQALTLCTGRMAHRGSRGIALPFHDHSTRRGWGVSVTPRLLFTPRKDLVPIVQEAGWAPGPVWTGTENLAPTGIRSPDHPARSQSLYGLCYPANQWNVMHA